MVLLLYPTLFKTGPVYHVDGSRAKPSRNIGTTAGPCTLLFLGCSMWCCCCTLHCLKQCPVYHVDGSRAKHHHEFGRRRYPAGEPGEQAEHASDSPDARFMSWISHELLARTQFEVAKKAQKVYSGIGNAWQYFYQGFSGSSTEPR